MGKKSVLLMGMILAKTVCAAGAQEGQLGVDLDLRWVSKYLWRGFDLLDDKAAFQPSINLDLFGTGLSANFWGSYAGSSKGGGSISTVDATEQDYTIAYDTTLLEGQELATEVTANFIYYDYIDAPDKQSDAEEIGVGFTWPNLCPAGVVGSYYVGRIWPARSKSDLSGDYAGWIHILSLGYDLTLGGILPETADQVISVSAEIVYNDGFNGDGDVDHDWSHATLAASAPIAVGELTFTPAIYYQSSFEDSVNPEDELYAGVSLSYSF
ncbi:MAG: hypothetical protein ACYTEL_08150 [Planctomycetota bacterium]|jgi:hypothetical protein